MTQNVRTTSEQEQNRTRDLNDPLRFDASPDEPGVNVYDRPTLNRPATGNMFSMILAILVILILAYFVFQWLF